MLKNLLILKMFYFDFHAPYCCLACLNHKIYYFDANFTFEGWCSLENLQNSFSHITLIDEALTKFHDRASIPAS